MSEIRFRDIFNLDGAVCLNTEAIDASEFIPAISSDSRTVAAGQVFWVLSGQRFDGHNFVDEARRKGAVLAVVQSDRAAMLKNVDIARVQVPDTLKALQQLAARHRAGFDIPLLALTGSNGKTTCKEMIGQVLSSSMTVHKTEGNLNNHIGCPFTLLALRKEHQLAVIELGTNHPGEIAALAEITQPTAALITNVGGAHLEFFKNEQEVAREKLTLFRFVKSGGTLFLNKDDAFTAPFTRKDCRLVGFSLNGSADVRGKILSINAAGRASFRLNDKVDVQLRIAGVHNVRNALAAAAVGLTFGLREAQIKDALEAYTAFDKRMQVVQKKGVTIINDSYNANPASMIAAFDTVKEMKPAGKLYLILGDMFELGELAGAMHTKIIKEALAVPDSHLLVLGDNMVQAARSAVQPPSGRLSEFRNHKELAENLAARLKKGDLMLIKGSRGMQMEKILDLLDI